MKKIALTSGDPAGIGPDLCLQLSEASDSACLIVLGDISVLKARAKIMGLAPSICEVSLDDSSDEFPVISGKRPLYVHHIPVKKHVKAGHPDPANASYVLQQLSLANDGCLRSDADAVLTMPVSKAVINQGAGANAEFFTGHTEFFCRASGAKEVLMVMVSDSLIVALFTTHVPLREVVEYVEPDKLSQAILLLNRELQRYHLCKNQPPRIAVLGLNPHAGEGGFIGSEEVDVMQPVIDRMNKKRLNLVGPISADSAFLPDKLEQMDAYLSMYHDQALPVFKQMSFQHGANMTFGLPYLRLSVDHGSAFDLAGTGRASNQSALYAIRLSVRLLNVASG